MIATSGFLTALECTKFDFSQGTEGAYSTTPDPLAGLRKPTSKKRGGKETGKDGRGGRGKGRVETGNGGNGRNGVGMPGKGREAERKGERKGGEERKVRTPLRQFLHTPLVAWTMMLLYCSFSLLSVIYSLTEIETETEINIISLTKTEIETEMFCETETKYKRNSEHMKRNSN